MKTDMKTASIALVCRPVAKVIVVLKTPDSKTSTNIILVPSIPSSTQFSPNKTVIVIWLVVLSLLKPETYCLKYYLFKELVFCTFIYFYMRRRTSKCAYACFSFKNFPGSDTLKPLTY